MIDTFVQAEVTVMRNSMRQDINRAIKDEATRDVMATDVTLVLNRAQGTYFSSD